VREQDGGDRGRERRREIVLILLIALKKMNVTQVILLDDTLFAKI